MQKPLKKGSKIAIVATAKKIDDASLDYAKELLKTWGLIPVEAKNLRKKHHQFSATDKERLEDLQWALDNDEIEAIIGFRGGYGTVRILEKLDFSKVKKNPKWLVGYSDVTALHNALNVKTDVPTLHATMPVNFKENTQEALQTLRQALFGESYTIKVQTNESNRFGEAKTEIVGGNLSLLYSLLGTPYDIDTSGKILFIEDLDEYLYHIDRMMWSLKLAGKLKNIKGLIVGGMTGMLDNAEPFGQTVQEIILSIVENNAIPVCFDFPAGHIDDNRAIILNKKAMLKVGSAGVELKF